MPPVMQALYFFEMKHLKKIIYFWAACDLLFAVKYFIGCLISHEIPIYTQLKYIIQLFNTPMPSVQPWVAICLTFFELSIIASGYLLFRQNRYAAILCYIQTPIRLLFAHSSISFLQSFPLHENPLKYLTILLMIEGVKLLTIILWQLKKLYRQETILSDRP